MSRDVYHEMFAHITWHTKCNMRCIVPKMEQQLYDFIRRRALAAPGVFVHGIGGTDDHVHMIARICPTVAIPEWMGKIKGGSAHDINEMPQWRKSLQWQSGYGFVMFGMNNLPWVVDYVNRQKEHHRNGTTIDRLERTSDNDETDGSSPDDDKPVETG
ncbi:MAG: hypothetical protein EHM48_01800 [Planctomycetaceae bacterium]|nr:MAG: hypothetical protein EHM48_01800 [Planctomycetaceae bacterium]